MIGIYKITSPNRKVYIGQSVNIQQRINKYKNLKCINQPRLYNSIIKYGFENHKIEIICECLIEDLNNQERFYQDLYNVLGKNGLNCKLTKSDDRSGKLSDVTRLKMSRKTSDITKEKLRQFNLGKKHSEETLQKMKNSQRLVSIKIKEKRKLKLIEYHKNNISKYIGRKIPNKTILKMRESKYNDLILDQQTGIFYFSISEVSRIYNIPFTTIWRQLNGKSKNKTNLIKLNNYE